MVGVKKWVDDEGRCRCWSSVVGSGGLANRFIWCSLERAATAHRCIGAALLRAARGMQAAALLHPAASHAVLRAA